MKYSAYLDINRDVLVLQELMRDYEARKLMSGDDKEVNHTHDNGSPNEPAVASYVDEAPRLRRVG